MNKFRNAVFTNMEIEPINKTVRINDDSSGNQGDKTGSAYPPNADLISGSMMTNIIRIMKSNIMSIPPPAGGGGGAGEPFAMRCGG